MAVRDFEVGSTDHITLGIGSLAFNGSSGITIMVLATRESGGAEGTLVALGSGTTGRCKFAWDASGSNIIFGTTTGGTSAAPLTITDGLWYIVGVTKAGGTTTPRFHTYAMALRSWGHANGGGTVANMAANPDTAYLGRSAANTNRHDGMIALAAVWKRELTDAEVESLAGGFRGFLATRPDALWPLNQADIGQNVIDWTGGGANQTAITGTAIGATSPRSWRWQGMTGQWQRTFGAASAALAGQSDGTSSATATGLNQTQPLTGSATGTSSATATGLKLTQPLAGTSAGTSSAGATLGTDQTLPAASATGTSSASGSLSTTVRLLGGATGTSSTGGDLSTVKPLAGASAGGSSATADLTDRPGAILAGASQGTSSAVGDLTDRPAAILAGTSAGGSSASGNLSPAVFLIGRSDGASSVVGNLITAAALRGTSQGTSSATATGLNQTQPLAGNSAGGSGATATITAIQIVAGQSTGGSSTSGSLALRAALIGVSGGGSGASGALSTQSALFGVSVGGSNATGSLALRVTLTQTSGGVIAISPVASIYAEGAAAILTATPDPGYAFVFWTINGQRFHTNPLHINIYQDLAVSATFTPVAIPAPPPGRARCPFCHGGYRCVVCGGTGWVRA